MLFLQSVFIQLLMQYGYFSTEYYLFLNPGLLTQVPFVHAVISVEVPNSRIASVPRLKEIRCIFKPVSWYLHNKI